MTYFKSLLLSECASPREECYQHDMLHDRGHRCLNRSLHQAYQAMRVARHRAGKKLSTILHTKFQTCKLLDAFGWVKARRDNFKQICASSTQRQTTTSIYVKTRLKL